MTTNLDALPERVEVIEHKLDALAVSVDERFKQVDGRFEQVDKRFEAIDRRFEAIDRRFEAIDKRFDEVSEHFVEQRQYTEFAFGQLERRMVDGFTRLEKVDSARLERVERKLDQFIDSQSRRTPRSKARRQKQ